MKNIFLIILLFSNITLIFQTIIYGLSPKELNVLADKGSLFFNDSKNLEVKLQKAYSFSKESNVIILMMDNFQGDLFKDIINKYPDLKKQLSGFTYYPNTLAYGYDTWTDIGSVMGGPKYELHKQWSRPNMPKPSHQKDDAYINNMLMAKKYNYSYTYYGLVYSKCRIFNSYGDNTICLKKNETKKIVQKDIKNIVMSKLNKNVNTLIDATIIFSKISSALSVPHIIKTRLANRKTKTKNRSTFTSYLDRIGQHSQLINMNNFSNTNSNKKTFKVIHNALTHTEWMMNKKCQVVNSAFRSYDGYFNTTYCSIKLLVNFFDKLKKLSIYNKTKIIIVSDHGDSEYYLKKGQGKPFNALLLVKDFNTLHALSTSNQFMSNTDTYGISLSGISNNEEIALDPIRNPQKNRELIHVKKLHKWKLFTIGKAFKVKDNIFDKNNWEELNEKQIQELGQEEYR